MHAEGQSYSIPGTRVPVIMDSNNAMTEAILRFVFLLENRRIIDERLIVFRDVLNATLHDLRGLYNFDLLGAMMDALPLEDPNGIIQPYSPPGREKLPALFDLIDRTIKQGTRPISYMEDFIVEIQNLMLGEIFTKPVEHRYPLDGAEIVVRLDQFEEIYRWLGQTPWGSEYAAIEERVRQKFAGDGGIPANSLTRSG